ncbi:MAG: septal ring lytic transglycosylase RlpA family lipoprotein [Gammaproteobacteria bacterium HGW-Gammaproteobacteria-3]|nr:MAG: septal ring lytic transglycosylase RlpA family lipoprotein [Gammaproteobacteria bacterium HGW-Gammaproteobacteria-3]
MNNIILAIPVFIASSCFISAIPTATAAQQQKTQPSSYVDDSSPPARRTTASWYGPKFHGKKTASGQKFNMYAMTAAHKTLPLLSYAEVTNPRNDRSVIVRINDRGPFHGKRGMDLSYAAAKKLGIAKAGVGEVVIRPLEREQALSLLKEAQDLSSGG